MRFYGSGVQPWFEDDLTDAEIEKIQRFEAERGLTLLPLLHA